MPASFDFPVQRQRSSANTVCAETRKSGGGERGKQKEGKSERSRELKEGKRERERERFSSFGVAEP